MLTEFCPLLTIPSWHWWRNSFTVICKHLHIFDIFSTTYLPCLVNVVKERPPERSHMNQLRKALHQPLQSSTKKKHNLPWLYVSILYKILVCSINKKGLACRIRPKSDNCTEVTMLTWLRFFFINFNMHFRGYRDFRKLIILAFVKQVLNNI